MAPAMIVVIGCGNPTRGDDGLGPEVVRMLRDRPVEGAKIRLLDAGTDGMAAMFAARGCGTLIVIDACRSGSEPGTIFDVPGAELERAYEPSLNLHDFRWDHALHAGRRIFREEFPVDVTVLLVEVASIVFGIGLSPRVAVAARTVVERVGVLIASRLTTAEPVA